MILWLGASAAARAQAPEIPLVRPGETVQGRLSPGDPPANGRGAFKVFRFDASEGQRYELTMKSADFDAYLTVAHTVAGITSELASDDDSGGGTDARVRFLAPATGSFLVIAQSYAPGGVGAFSVALEAMAAPPAARPTTLRIGESVQGALTETSAVLDDDMPYDLYTFTGQSGQSVVITMRSDDFDTYLYLAREEGRGVEELAADDDGGGGTDSRIRFTLPAPGTYRIHAAALYPDAEGSYTLTLEEAPAVVLRPAEPLRLGARVDDELRETDPRTADDAHYRDWSYTAAAGERLRLAMRSDAFDTFLSIGRMVAGEFHTLADNDDGPDGTDSLLELSLEQAGTYIVRASSLFGSQTGPFTLQVDRME